MKNFLNSTKKCNRSLRMNRMLAVILFAAIFTVLVTLKLQSIASGDAVNDFGISQFNGRMLENVLHATYKPRTDRNSIFFIESRKREDKVITLNSRQACSVEAAGEAPPGCN